MSSLHHWQVYMIAWYCHDPIKVAWNRNAQYPQRQRQKAQDPIHNSTYGYQLILKGTQLVGVAPARLYFCSARQYPIHKTRVPLRVPGAACVYMNI